MSDTAPDPDARHDARGRARGARRDTRRAERRGRGPPARDIWRQPPARAAAAQPGPQVPVAFPQRADLRADRCRGGHGGARALGGYRRHPRGGDRQRGDRLCAGGPRRTGDGGDPRHARAALVGDPRRGAHHARRGGSGAGRHRARGGGRPRARRPAPAGGARSQGRGGRAHRRIGPRRQGHRPGRSRGRSGRPHADAVFRHPCRGGDRARAGQCHRRRHGNRPHQRDARRGRDADHAAGGADGPVRALADGVHPDRGGHAPRLWHLRQRHGFFRAVHGRGRALGRGDPRGAAGGADHHARRRRAGDGRAQRHRPPPARDRDARLGLGDLHRQDRHAHPQRDDGGDARHGRRRDRGDRRRLRPRGRCADRGPRGAGGGDGPGGGAVQRCRAARDRGGLACRGRPDGGRADGAGGQDHRRGRAALCRLDPARRDPVRCRASLHGDARRGRRRARAHPCQGRARGGPGALPRSARRAGGHRPARHRRLADPSRDARGAGSARHRGGHAGGGGGSHHARPPAISTARSRWWG